MKELSLEEKARAYDEALERARKEYKNHESFKGFCEKLLHIFPILKENEDERIRKELIAYVKDQQSSFISAPDCRDKYEEEENNKFNTWIAWLEKQDESIKIKKGKNYLCTKTHKYAGVEWIEGIKYYSPEDYSLVNQGCTCYCPEYSKEEHNNFFKEVECLEADKEIRGKDEDLEKIFNDEYSKFSNDVDAMDYCFPIDLADYKDFAKHFFELGLKVKNKNNE